MKKVRIRKAELIQTVWRIYGRDRVEFRRLYLPGVARPQLLVLVDDKIVATWHLGYADWPDEWPK